VQRSFDVVRLDVDLLDGRTIKVAFGVLDRVGVVLGATPARRDRPAAA
jgi:hypothetical protein